MKPISLTSKVQAEVKINFSLTVKQASALQALSVYGADSFLETFYKHMGKAYLQPFEKELREVFAFLKDPLANEIERANDFERDVINLNLKIKNESD